MAPTQQQLDAVCDYLNVDKNQHLAAHGKWHLDAGKLVTALEAAGITLGESPPPVENAKQRNDRLKGEYFEEVEMFVDGLVEDIKSGHLDTKYAATVQLEEGLPLSRYVMDSELNPIVLAHSEYPTAFFFEGSKIKDTRGGSAEIPWQEFALSAMEADCMALLGGRPEYIALPQRSPDPGEEEPDVDRARESEEGEEEHDEVEAAGPVAADEGEGDED